MAKTMVKVSYLIAGVSFNVSRFWLSCLASGLLGLSFTDTTCVIVERAWLPLKMEVQWPTIEVDVYKRERKRDKQKQIKLIYIRGCTWSDNHKDTEPCSVIILTSFFFF